WDLRREALQAQERRFLQESAGKWLAGLPDLKRVRWEVLENFNGGLLERLEVSLATWRRRAEPLFASVDLRSLRVNGRSGFRGAITLAASSYLPRLTSLELWNNDIGPEGARALAASHRRASFFSLALGNNRLRNEGVRALIETPFLA